MHECKKALGEFAKWLLMEGDLMDLATDEFGGLVQRFLDSQDGSLEANWRDAESDPPPKDGSIIILHEGGSRYVLVRWDESSELVEGGWFLTHSGPEGFLFDDELVGMRWRPFEGEGGCL